MYPQLQLVRAVSSEFALRKFRSFVTFLGIAALLVVVLVVWLSVKNSWWLLIAVPVIGIVLIGLVAALTAWRIIHRLRPDLSLQQTESVKDFVDTFERTAEHLQTPVFMIMFFVIRDIIWPRQESFIYTATKDGTTLHKDFLQLGSSFKQEEKK